MNNFIDTIRYGVCEDSHLETLQNLTDSELVYFQSFLTSIPNPPANSSPETRSEIDTLLSLQRSHRASMRSIIKIIDEDLTYPFVQLCNDLCIDPMFNKVNTILEKGKKASLFYKAYFNRARPFQLSLYSNPNFAPMPSISAWTPSYPSGHTIQAEMLCDMYCAEYPMHSMQFQSVAKLISDTRLVGGYHFNSDISSGKLIVKLLGAYNDN